MRRIRVDAVLVQAVIAATLSFAHIHDLAVAAGQDGWKAWLYPISVDLLLVAAWRRLRSGGKASGWCWFLIALAASLGANVATAGLLDLDSPPAWLRVLVAGWPAIAFLGGTLLAHTPAGDANGAGAGRTRFAEPAGPHASAPATEDAPEQVPALPEPLPEPAAPAIEPAPEPKADPEPKPVPATVPAPVVPVALIGHAQKIADNHRATTGARIDADTLCARLGVPAPMASAIAAQLT